MVGAGLGERVCSFILAWYLPCLVSPLPTPTPSGLWNQPASSGRGRGGRTDLRFELFKPHSSQSITCRWAWRYMGDTLYSNGSVLGLYALYFLKLHPGAPHP